MKKSLVMYGYDNDLVQSMSTEDILEIYGDISDPSVEVELESTIIESDNIEEIEDFLYATDDELIASGFTEEEIVEMEEEIQEMDFDEMIDELGASPAEYYVLQEVFEEYENSSNEQGRLVSDSYDDTDLVTSSGSISTSAMSYTMTTTNKTGKTSPVYNVKINFAWKKAFAMRNLTKKIAAAWSGSFNTRNVSSNLNYAFVSTGNTWSGTSQSNQKASIKHTPNKGIMFSFKQNKKINNSRLQYVVKNGSVSFQLFRNKRNLNSCKLVSRYSHPAVGAIGFGVNSNAAASINVGVMNNQSKQLSKNITN